MEKKEVLKICVKAGFFLDKEMLDFFVGLNEENVLEIVGKLEGFGVKDKILTKRVFDKYKDRFDIRGRGVGVKSMVRVLKNFEGGNGGVVIGDFVDYFRKEFEDLRDILLEKNEVGNLISIRRIGRENGVFSIIGRVFEKRVTKNRNLLFEVEDLTGRIVVLVNRENKQLFEQAQGVMLDDVLLFRCSGSSKMLFVSEIVYPGAGLGREVFGDRDEFVAFVSDLHVGSRYFLEENFLRFIGWLNGEVGDGRSKEIARKVKYLVLVGDNIDGVGVYPGQEDRLNIKSVKRQYEKLAEILRELRRDVEILVLPGIHDAVWVGDPLPGVSEKWAPGFYGMDNLKILSSPVFFEIGGLKFFCYYGSLVKGFRNLVLEGEKKEVSQLIEEVLKRRKLSGVYGVGDVVFGDDNLVLKDLPDVFVVGGQHKFCVESYNNILGISTAAFQGRTDFEERVGVEPDVAKVGVLNLKSREVKVLDFGRKDIVWEEGDDLVCRLEDKLDG